MRPPGAGRAIALNLAVLLAQAAAAGPPEDAQASGAGPSDSSIAVAGTGTVTGALQGKEGVRIQTLCTHCNSANVQVGGLNQDLVPLLRDGYPIFGGLATSFVFGMLPADAIAEARVDRGPGAAALPGSAAGGVIRLIGSTPEEMPRLDVVLEGGSYDLRGGSVRAAGRFAPWVSGHGFFGTQRADPIDDDGDGWNDVGAAERDFADARVFLTTGRDHDFDVGASWVQDDALEGRGAFDVLIAQQQPGVPAWTREDTLAERREIRGGWEGRLSRGGKVQVRLLDATREQSVLSQLTADPAFTAFSELFERFRIDEDDRWGIARFERPVGMSLLIDAAVEYSEQSVTAETIEAPGAPAPAPATDFVETRSAYADVDWSPAPKWSLRLGLRWDDLEWGGRDLGDSQTERRLSPRGTLLYNPAPGWTLKLIAGRTTRAPRPIFAEVCCGQRYQRSIEARAEIGTTAAFEGVFQPGPQARVSLYVAHTTFENSILRLVGWSQYYTQTYTLGNVPDAEAETAEIAGRWSPFGWLSLDGSIGWLSVRNTGDPDVPVRVTPPSFAVPQTVIVPIRRIPYRPERTGSLAASFAAPRGIVVSVQADYTGSMLIQQYDPDPNAGQNILLDEMRRTPSFWLVNLAVRVPTGRLVDVVGSVDNLTDSLQDDLGDPTTDYNWGPLSGRSWRLGLRFHLDR